MGAAAILTVSRDGEAAKTYPLQGEVLLGRGDECVIRLNDRAISRRHALFRSVGDSIQVEKKSEFAPLSVNGAECTRAVLKEGDLVSIGPYLVRISGISSRGATKLEVPEPVQEISSAGVGAGESLASADLPALPESTSQDLGFEAPVESEGGGLVLGSAEPVLPVAGQELPQTDSPLQGNDFQNPPLSLEPPSELPAADSPAPKFEMEAPETFSKESGPIDEDGNTRIAAPEKIAIKLVFPPGTANFTTYEMTKDEVSIGRGSSCDIVLNDKKVSRKNTIIRRAGLNFIIKDLESANGTFVNGNKIEEQQLNANDVIRIGVVEFEFKAISTDYKDREKNFLTVPAEADIPNLDLQTIISEGAVVPETSPLVAVPAAPRPPSPPEFQFASAPHAPIQFSGPPNPGDIPGGIPGIVGIGGNGGKKRSLSEKFRDLPKRTQILAIFVAGVFVYWFLSDDDIAPVAKKKNPKKPPAVASGPSSTPSAPNALTFEALSEEKKQFVESRHAAAFDFYKNGEFDKALFEIQKIFALVSDYKDAREIERYAKEGKRKQEAIAEEQRKREEEAKQKVQIAQLLEETKKKMEKKQYEQARELFLQILALDPDNASVANWRKEVEAYEEELRVRDQAKQVQEQINKHAWEVYNEGLGLKKKGKFHSAIEEFQRSIDIGASDQKLIGLSKQMIVACRSAIRRMREPILAEGKRLEAAGEFVAAFAAYQKATRIDPQHPEGYAGINRIKGILHDRAKAIYTEAILAESYSDFNNARKMFQECLQVAPQDDVYHDRASRKLSHYFRKEEAPTQ